jgi:hypothetical protein
MSESALEKVEILLRAVGDAPVLKKNKFKLNRTQKIAFVSDFLRKATKCEADERIFLVNYFLQKKQVLTVTYSTFIKLFRQQWIRRSEHFLTITPGTVLEFSRMHVYLFF